MPMQTRKQHQIPAALYVVGILLLSACSTLSVDDGPKKIQEAFQAEVNVRELKWPASRPASVLAVWEAETAAGPAGYGLRVRGRTRSGNFRAFLVLDNEYVIQSLEIERYRGARGGEIRRNSFEQQFRGKNPESALALGEDIDAVTGATISSRSVAGVVRQSIRWLQSIAIGRNRNPHPLSSVALGGTPGVVVHDPAAGGVFRTAPEGRVVFARSAHAHRCATRRNLPLSHPTIEWRCYTRASF